MFHVDGILLACLPDLCDLVVQAMQARGWQVRNLGCLPSVDVVSAIDYSGSYCDGRIKVNGAYDWRHCSGIAFQGGHFHETSDCEPDFIRDGGC